MATKTKIVPRLFANYCGLTKQSGLSNGHVDFLGARCSSLQSWRSYTAEQRAKTKSEKKHSFSDSKVMGIEMLRNPKANKSMAFTLKERQTMGIHGLLPPVVYDQDGQVEIVVANIKRIKNDLDKYSYMMDLLDRNEKLFYRVLTRNIEELLPIVYTPTVSQACQQYGMLFRQPRGLYITINDIGHIYDILSNWPEADSKVIVVTDGERILGLGDLGAYGMAVPVGKLALYTAMGGVPPNQCLPIVLDVGTDNDDIINDPMYIGLRHKRVRGRQYNIFIEEFMEAVVARFGHSTLIHFEDFANANAFRLLNEYKDKNLTFNSDIQGTATTTLAGIYGALRITKSQLKEQTFLIVGAGEASIGIADLIVAALKEDGLTEEEAIDKLWVTDSKGLLTVDRPAGGLVDHKSAYVKEHTHMTDLNDIVNNLKPTILIGVSGAFGVFTPEVLQSMAAINERPTVFALSNPADTCECTAEEAYQHTQGRCVFASGNASDPVLVGSKTYHPSTTNNAYVYPGMGLGCIVSGAYHMTDGMFVSTSKALSQQVSDVELEEGRLFPPMCNICDVSTQIAASVVQYTYEHNQAAMYPEPKDKIAYVKAHQYTHDYDSFTPHVYDWPGVPSE